MLIAVHRGGTLLILWSLRNDNDKIKNGTCLIREKVVTFRMVKLNLLLSIFCITKWVTHF